MKTPLFGALLISFAATAQALPTATISAAIDGPVFSSGPVSVNVAPGPETLEVSNPWFAYQVTTGIVTGDAAGNYGLAAHASYRGEATASYSYSDTFTNLGATASSFNMTFNVPVFAIFAEGACGEYGDWWCGEGSYSEGMYSYSILVNGVSVFASHGSVRVDSLGPHIDLSGDLFGMSSELYANAGRIRLSDLFTGTVSLGELAAGESLNFSLVSSITARVFADPTCDAAISDCRGMVTSGLGDPFDIESAGGSFSISSANQVPEPSIAILLLPALALCRRSLKTGKLAKKMR